jgi:hypothetical protein
MENIFFWVLTVYYPNISSESESYCQADTTVVSSPHAFEKRRSTISEDSTLNQNKINYLGLFLKVDGKRKKYYQCYGKAIA